jgi:hypothetical protein
MKKTALILVVAITVFSCNQKQDIDLEKKVDWSSKKAPIYQADSLTFGKTYLSIYSQIYSFSEHKKHNLTAMVSLRNTSDNDTIYILKADYYNTHGAFIRSYFDNPIYLSPLETVDIIIPEIETLGGTGSNFIFEWHTPKNAPEPLFEAVMSSTMGQQGLSFTTQGRRTE